MEFNPADNIQVYSILENLVATHRFLTLPHTLLSAKPCSILLKVTWNYLYSRHSSPSNLYLDKALAAMEGTETANVSASGMGAITPTLLQLCGGDYVFQAEHIWRNLCFLKNFTPRFGIKLLCRHHRTRRRAAITSDTKVLYCETVSNPLLEVADIAGLSLPKT
jgi:methionine-gamma-lyase